MSNFSQYFPIAGGSSGGGGLSNTYASFHVNDGTVAGFPLTTGYTPSTGLYEHPEGGVFLRTGYTLKDQGSLYSNAVTTGVAYAERAEPTPSPVVTSRPDRPTVNNSTTGYNTYTYQSSLHYVPTDGLGTIYQTSKQPYHWAESGISMLRNILVWEKQADGSFVRGSNLTLQKAVNLGGQKFYPSNVVYDPDNQVWVAIVYQHGTSPTGITIYTSSTIDGTWTAQDTKQPIGGATYFSGNDWLTGIPLWVDQGVVYWSMKSMSGNQHGKEFFCSFDTSTNTIIGTHPDTTAETPVPITPTTPLGSITDGTSYSTKQSTGFTIYSDASLTTQTGTFTDTTVGLALTDNWVLIDGTPYNVSNLNDGEGYRLIKWSFDGINIIGDGTVRTLTTITGLSGNLAQTVFFKIG